MDNYQDFQLLIGTFQMNYIELSKNKDFVVAILVYKLTVNNTNVKMSPLDSLTLQMYT